MMAGCPGCGKSKERHIRARRGTSAHRIPDHSTFPLAGLSKEFKSANAAGVSGATCLNDFVHKRCGRQHLEASAKVDKCLQVDQPLHGHDGDYKHKEKAQVQQPQQAESEPPLPGANPQVVPQYLIRTGGPRDTPVRFIMVVQGGSGAHLGGPRAAEEGREQEAYQGEIWVRW